MKQKKCRACKGVFTPRLPLQVACGPACAEAIAKQKRERKCLQDAREQRRSRREALEKVKTRGEHLREAQAAFNEFVRLRDADLPCISCGRPATWDGQWDCGHYRSVGSSPSLRFDPNNTAKQCLPCNRHLSGNLIRMRVGLISRIGLAEVERLEGPQQPLKLTIPEIQELKAKFRAEVRRLKKVN